mgnify:FL=1
MTALSEDSPLASLGVFELIDAMPELCSLYREDGLLMAVNRANERMVGLSREALVGRFNLFDDDRVIGVERVAAYRRAFAGELQVLPVMQVELRTDTLGLELRPPVLWLETTLVPLRRRADGRAAYVLGVSRDVTALMDARREIKVQRETIAALDAAHREIAAQRATIQALSTPVIEVWEGVVMLPLLGHLDDARFETMSASLLAAVTRARARFVVIDLTGVAALGGASVGQLVGVIRAVRLLGARGLLVGIRPELAQAMVAAQLGIEGISVYADLRQALRACIRGSAAE